MNTGSVDLAPAGIRLNHTGAPQPHPSDGPAWCTPEELSCRVVERSNVFMPAGFVRACLRDFQARGLVESASRDRWRITAEGREYGAALEAMLEAGRS